MGEAAVLTAMTPVDSSSPWVRANDLAGGLNRLYAALVAVTVSVIAADDWGAHGGVRSPEHWLALRAGLAAATAGQAVALARRASMLLLMIRLLDEGQLSLDQAAVIARHVPASYEASVVELAPKLTVAQLRRALSRYPFETVDTEGDTDNQVEPETAWTTADRATTSDFCGDLSVYPNGVPAPGSAGQGGDDEADSGGEGMSADTEAAEHSGDPAQDAGPSPDEADAPSGRPFAGLGFGLGTEEEPVLSETAARASLPGRLMTWWDRGRFYVQGDLPADLGALLAQALKEAKDALFTAGETRAGPADALAEIANRSLATVEPVSRADRYRIYLHLDIGGAWLNARGAIPRHLADRYACISAHAVILERDGKPVNVGRTQRGIPARTRRLVEDRDRGCAYPGCPATRFVEIHHLHHWEDGGGTDYDNLICLCPHHHTGHHQGAFTITPAKPTSSAGAIAADDRHHGGSARHGDGVLCPFVFHDDRGRPIQVQPPPPRPGLSSRLGRWPRCGRRGCRDHKPLGEPNGRRELSRPARRTPRPELGPLLSRFRATSLRGA